MDFIFKRLSIIKSKKKKQEHLWNYIKYNYFLFQKKMFMYNVYIY